MVAHHWWCVLSFPTEAGNHRDGLRCVASSKRLNIDAQDGWDMSLDSSLCSGMTGWITLPSVSPPCGFWIKSRMTMLCIFAPTPLWIAGQVRNDANCLVSPSPLIPLPSRERGMYGWFILLSARHRPSGLRIKSAMTDPASPCGFWIKSRMTMLGHGRGKVG